MTPALTRLPSLLLVGRCLPSAAGFGPGAGLVPPNTSLATLPVAYFGGKGGVSGPRSEASVAMLSKMRLVILEKWEGPCWDDCIANSTATPARPCLPSCNEEHESLAVLRRVRGLNPGVSTMLYLNALLLFPFYELAQRFIDADALLKDVRTGLPVTLKVRRLAGCVGLFFSRPS